MFLRPLTSFLLLALVFCGCAEFRIQRSYLSEMEQEDHSFYTPNEDFPVAAGDSGRTWYSDDEFRQRIPRTEEELAEERQRLYLKEELRSLEASLSEDEARYYQRHVQTFSTDSEKIYFLKLGPDEQRDYLAARGMLEFERSPASVAPPQYFGLRSNHVSLGMSKDQVLDNFGRPSRVEVAGNPRYENERWLYVGNGASKYIYFEGGIVHGWE